MYTMKFECEGALECKQKEFHHILKKSLLIFYFITRLNRSLHLILLDLRLIPSQCVMPVSINEVNLNVS